jgi:hypothetical protein
MREIFQRHLRPLDGQTYQVRECQVSFILSYRQAERCALQYALRLVEPSAGRERIQWVSGWIYAGGKVPRKWEKLRRSEPGRGIPEALRIFEPVSYIPELDMVVLAFPYDRYLPALPLLMSKPQPDLEPLLLARFGAGDWQAEAWDVEPVRYMAETRATLRLTVRARNVATGREEERRFYAKVYAHEEEGERTYQVMRALCDKANADGARFNVGRPVTFLSSLRTLVQEETPGTSLEDILLREEEATPAVRKVARALAALHLDHLDTPPRPSRRSYLAELENTKKLLQRFHPRLGPVIEEIIDATVAGFQEVSPTSTHGDILPGHFLLDGDSVAIIDLDKFAEADPVWEVAEVLAYLTSAPFNWLPLPCDRAWRAAQAFAEEYFAHVPEVWRDRLPFHYAGAVLQLALLLTRDLVPGWPDKIEALLEEAKNSLEGRVW